LKIEIINTNDGSNSILNQEINETYHSTFGAITESTYVFIKNGLERIDLEEITIFEVGYGTGLNAFLSAIYATEKKININYYSIEKYPLDEPVVLNLNYGKLLGYPEMYHSMQMAKWDKFEEINLFFKLQKIKQDFIDFNFNQVNKPNVIYYDAFSPVKQPEMWDYQNLQKAFNMLNFNGILVTYTSAGIVKNALRQAGFQVLRLKGPPGKHHMVLAIKTNK
jgi:tRNA U34 5-methylaminomethyl-2-thiouridine-forming methyltransferase MnmC